MAAARGFTLTELVIAVVILGILTAMAVPAYTEFVRNSRRAGVLNEFVAALNLARSEAVKRGVPVVVCSTADGAGCGGSWTQGWLVLIDLNLDGDYQDAGERLRAYQVTSPAYALTASLTDADDDPTDFLAYQPSGATDGTRGHFTYCDARGVRSARAVIINLTGRPRLSQDSDGDGIHENEDDDGDVADLTCS